MKTTLSAIAILALSCAPVYAGTPRTFDPEPKRTFYQCYPFPATTSQSMHRQRVALGLCDGGFIPSDDSKKPEPVDPCSCKDGDASAEGKG